MESEDDDVYDSDSSASSRETKRVKCLPIGLNDPNTSLFCPICNREGGRGAHRMFIGLKALIAHASDSTNKLIKQHMELAKRLVEEEEELLKRGSTGQPAGEIYRKWKGPDLFKGKEIVWPPMVIIIDPKLEKDESDKFIGIGNPDLMGIFQPYNPVKAKQSYGPDGHRGMSILIFDATHIGYLEADLLSQSFAANGRGRDALHNSRKPSQPGADRPLYGYLAEKHDLEKFNKHHGNSSKVNHEIISFSDMVLKNPRETSC